MKTDTTCCGETGRTGQLEYPRWHAGQLVTDQDLNDQLQYLLRVQRLHNRMLHGWGVVCGLLVCKVSDPHDDVLPWVVEIKPGFALSPWGEPIMVDCPTHVDLRQHGRGGPTGEPLDPKSDPWCSEVYRRKPEGPVYICVHYWRAMTRPVRVQPLGCGCDDTRCEYSRWRDSFKVCLLDECPQSHEDPPDLERLFRGGNPECPPCPEDDCVVLAKVEVDEEGTILEIDNCACRRIVVAFGNFWRRCEEEVERRVRVGPIVGPAEFAAAREHTIAFRGNFESMPATALVRITTEDGVEDLEIKSREVEPELMRLTVAIPEDAKPGPRTLSIADADGNEIARRRSVFRVAGPPPGRGEEARETRARRTRRQRETRPSEDGEPGEGES